MSNLGTKSALFGLAIAGSVWISAPLAAQPPAEAVEAFPPELRLAPASGRRTANGFGRGFCAPSMEALRGPDLRVGRLRDLVSLRSVATGNGALDLNPAKLATIARLSCMHGSDPSTAAWLTAYEQVLINGLDLDDAAIDALLAAAITQTGRQWQLPCGADRPAGATRPPPNEEAFATLMQLLCTGTARGGPIDELTYWMDSGGGLSASRTPSLHRILYVGTALNSSRFREVAPVISVQPTGMDTLQGFFVYSDLDQLDVAAAQRELSTLGLSPAEQAFGMAVLARIRIVATAYKAAFDTAMRADPILTRVFLDAPRQAFESYRRDATTYAEPLRAAWEIERAFLAADRSRLSSCAAASRESFLRYVRARNPRSMSDVRAALDEPVGYVIAAALLRCEAGGDQAITGPARAVLSLIERLAVQRGPRIGGYVAAARQAAIEIATNPSFRARIPVEGLFRGIRAEQDWTRGASGGMGRSAIGVVRTAAQRGDVLHIEFRTEIYQQPQLSCTPTGRIARIERDGTVRYEESCVVVGHTPVNVTPDPVDIPTPLAGGISAGVHLEALASSSGPLAYPIHVRPAAEADDAAAYGIVFGR